MKPLPVRPPVFVDSSGHRQRRIRRVGAVVAVPVVGYLVLLASSVLGGPRIDTPLIPLPEAAKQQPAPHVTQVPTQTTETPKPGEPSKTGENSVQPVAEETSAPTTPPGESPTTPASSTPATTLVPTATVTPPSTTAPPSTTTPPITTTPPVTAKPGHGKPTAPPGRTKTPSKP